MNGDQNLLAGIGKVDQFAQAGLGFTKSGNHVTTMVLFLLTAREMLNHDFLPHLKCLAEAGAVPGTKEHNKVVCISRRSAFFDQIEAERRKTAEASPRSEWKRFNFRVIECADFKSSNPHFSVSNPINSVYSVKNPLTVKMILERLRGRLRMCRFCHLRRCKVDA